MAISSTRLVFLSTGKYTSTAKYTRFSKANLDLLSHATGFVISVTGVYSIYGNGPYTDLINGVMSQVEVVAQTKKPFYIGLVLGVIGLIIFPSKYFLLLSIFVGILILLFGKKWIDYAK